MELDAVAQNYLRGVAGKQAKSQAATSYVGDSREMPFSAWCQAHSGQGLPRRPQQWCEGTET